MTWTRRSVAASTDDSTSDLILLDSIGELRAVYPLASIVFVGGSISPTGGHNILEPAAVGACTVTGAHTFNFKAIIETFLEASALVQLPTLSETDAPAALSRIFQELLTNDERRRTIGENARAVLERNRGATARTIKLLAPLFDAAPNHPEQHQPESAQHSALSA
jgi:3-deoxy-D-manno-octulosonic-acid transferase